MNIQPAGGIDEPITSYEFEHRYKPAFKPFNMFPMFQDADCAFVDVYEDKNGNRRVRAAAFISGKDTDCTDGRILDDIV